MLLPARESNAAAPLRADPHGPAVRTAIPDRSAVHGPAPSSRPARRRRPAPRRWQRRQPRRGDGEAPPLENRNGFIRGRRPAFQADVHTLRIVAAGLQEHARQAHGARSMPLQRGHQILQPLGVREGQVVVHHHHPRRLRVGGHPPPGAARRIARRPDPPRRPLRLKIPVRRIVPDEHRMGQRLRLQAIQDHRQIRRPSIIGEDHGDRGVAVGHDISPRRI
jgi:hypothetical protein